MTVPVVGMGVTEGIGSDRYAYTIIEVRRDGKELVIQRDNATRTDTNGLSESQTYICTPNPEGMTRVIVLRKGNYHLKGSKSYHYTIDVRKPYADPSH